MEIEQIKELEKLLKCLANNRRLLIIKLLKKYPNLTVGQISGVMKLSFRATSRHLNNLYKQSIVEKRQKSLNMHYSLSKTTNQVIETITSKL